MTREEFIVALRTADDRRNYEPLFPWAQQVADCDAEQRAEIARLTALAKQYHDTAENQKNDIEQLRARLSGCENGNR